MPETIDRVAIFGGGNTGTGLAKALALAGIEVVLVEKTRGAATASEDLLTERMDHEISKFGMTESEKRAVLRRIHFTAHAREAAEADVFIESVPEIVAVKRRVLLEMEGVEPQGDRKVKLANCAAIAISDLQPGLAAPQRVLGFHVIPPADKVPLVELVAGSETEEASVEVARSLARRLGKRAVSVFEYPGYITTRIIVPFLNEAMYALMEGVASAAEIDEAMKAGFGMSCGPLRLADDVGLDQVLFWMDSLHRQLGDIKYRPCPLLRRLVRGGHLGQKTGRGFFEYSGQSRGALEAER